MPTNPIDALRKATSISSSASPYAGDPVQANTPLLPSMGQHLDDPTLNRSPWEARLRGFGSGALEGLRSLSTPMSLAGSLFGAPEMGGARAIADPAYGKLEGAAADALPSAMAAARKAVRWGGITSPGTDPIEGLARGYNPPPTIAQQTAHYQSLPATSGEAAGEFNRESTPVGGEWSYNAGRTEPPSPTPRPIDPTMDPTFRKYAARPSSTPDFTGQLPEPPPFARFIGHQPGLPGEDPMPLYNVTGGPSHGSTMSPEGLAQQGIPIQGDTPAFDPTAGNAARDAAQARLAGVK